MHLRAERSPQLYVNGKGASKLACEASALGELFERLATNYLFSDLYLGAAADSAPFVFYPDERWFPFDGDALPAAGPDGVELLTPALSAPDHSEGGARAGGPRLRGAGQGRLPRRAVSGDLPAAAQPPQRWVLRGLRRQLPYRRGHGAHGRALTHYYGDELLERARAVAAGQQRFPGLELAETWEELSAPHDRLVALYWDLQRLKV